MHTESPAMPRAEAAPIGSDELAEGLMLVRASTLKIIRLQLAIERHDRSVARETVDDLVALDHRLQDYLAMVPAAAAEQILFGRELDAERAMLNREKLTLAAEVLRRPPESVRERRQSPDDDWLGPRDLVIKEEEPSRSRRWLVAIAILASALATIAYFVGVPAAQAWLAAGGLR